MAVCPKCHQSIPTKEFQAHLRDCSSSTEEYPPELYVPSATPPWERPDRGVLLPDPESKPWWVNYLMYVGLAFLVGGLAVELIFVTTGFYIPFP